MSKPIICPHDGHRMKFIRADKRSGERYYECPKCGIRRSVPRTIGSARRS